MERIYYMEYIMDNNGVHVDTTKIQEICDKRTVTTLIELRNFLFLSKFYRSFVLGFSHISWSLSQVTKCGSKSKFF